jgi:hypothetical protein
VPRVTCYPWQFLSVPVFIRATNHHHTGSKQPVALDSRGTGYLFTRARCYPRTSRLLPDQKEWIARVAPTGPKYLRLINSKCSGGLEIVPRVSGETAVLRADNGMEWIDSNWFEEGTHRARLG